MVSDTDELEKEIDALTNSLFSIQEEVERLVSDNTKVAQNQKIYQQKYDKLVKKYELTEQTLNEKKNELNEMVKRKNDLNNFITLLKQQKNVIAEFEDKLFYTFISKIVIGKGKQVSVYLKSGEVITL